jgi:hypothetical protein
MGGRGRAGKAVPRPLWRRRCWASWASGTSCSIGICITIVITIIGSSCSGGRGGLRARPPAELRGGQDVAHHVLLLLGQTHLRGGAGRQGL